METCLVMKPKNSSSVLIPSVDSSIWITFILFVLSIIAGADDAISFLGLNGLFTAHITGNLVILAAHIVGGSQVPISQIISVPIFFILLAVTKAIASGLDRLRIPSLTPLLLFHFALLACSFLASIVAIKVADPNSLSNIVTGMFGVSAMAVQNAMVQTSIKGAPSTAVMTTNITRFTIDVGEVLLGTDPRSIAIARDRAINTWPAILGFFIGCAIGAASVAFIGLGAFAIPSALALLTIIMGLFAL